MLIMAIYKAHFPLKRKGSKTWGALALSALFLAKTPSEYIQRGFFLFLGSQKCTKNAPKLIPPAEWTGRQNGSKEKSSLCAS